MVSVIIPAYNCAKYLKRCMDSILSQSYSNLECIIVDDGSTDNETYKLCDKIKNEDKRVKVIHKQNEGAERAREDGVNISMGQYVMFVDADDYLEAGILDKCVQGIEKTGSDIVCFNYCLNDDGKAGFKLEKEEVIGCTEAIKNMLEIKKLDGNMWCKFYRREIFEKIKFDSRRNCDFITVFNVLKKAEQVLLLPIIGYHYSVIRESQSRNNTCHPREEEYVKATYDLYKECREDSQIAEAAEGYWLSSLLYVCIKMEKDKSISRKEERFRKIKHTLRRETVRYCTNTHLANKRIVHYLLCYFNLFRPIFHIYSLVRG